MTNFVINELEEIKNAEIIITTKGPSEIIIDEEPLEEIRMNAPLILEEIDEVPEHEQEVNQEPDHNIGDDDFQSTHTN